jgi:hypothetical protein
MRVMSLWVVITGWLVACTNQNPNPVTAAQPKSATPIVDVVYVSPFNLERPHRFNWQQEPIDIRQGTLAVFKVDPQLVQPTNLAEPILYVGQQTAQRLNQGHLSGHVVVIIPNRIPLHEVPIWFGEPGLPEQVDRRTIQTQLALAKRAGIKPLTKAQVLGVTNNELTADDLAALLRNHVAELLVTYSPQEKDLAETWRLPVATANRN